jgi:predicted DNA-binding protein
MTAPMSQQPKRLQLHFAVSTDDQVHTHLPDGGRQMQWWSTQHRILPRLHLSTSEEHEQRLQALSQRLDRERDALLREELGDFLASEGPWEARSFDYQRVSCPECQDLVLNP